MNILKRIYHKISRKKDVFIDENKYQIAKYISQNPIILEAGACDGRDTLQMATVWEKAQIHAFEPIESLFEETKKKVQNFKQIHIYKAGLASKTGNTTLYVSEGKSTGSSSIMKPKEHLEIHPEVLFKKEIEIEVFTIDEWAKKNNISKIDLMWLDLQGAEMSVLKSSPNILNTTKAIFSEVSLKQMYENTPLYPEFRAWLETQGFSVAWEDLPYEDMGNVLFVRK